VIIRQKKILKVSPIAAFNNRNDLALVLGHLVIICFARSGKGSIIEVPLLLLTSLRINFFISKKRFLGLFPIKPMVAHHDFCCQALLAIIGLILPKKIYCKLLHCPANPDINPLLPWPAHIAILPLFNLFFFWGVGLKSRHFNSICVL